MYLVLDVFLQKKQSAQDIPVCAVVLSIRVRVAESNKMPFQFLFHAEWSSLNETDVFKCVFSQAQLIWKREVSQLPIKENYQQLLFNIRTTFQCDHFPKVNRDFISVLCIDESGWGPGPKQGILVPFFGGENQSLTEPHHKLVVISRRILTNEAVLTW